MMSKKKVLIITIIILIMAIIAIGTSFIKYKITENNKRNYQIEKIEKYNYFVLKNGEKYGVIDNKGNIIIDAQFNSVKIPNPSKDIFVCYIENETRILNSSNQEILTQYSQLEPIKLKNVASDLMYEKSVLTYKENNKYGIIDFTGNKLTEPIYDSIESLTYREGELLTNIDGKCGVININGFTIIDNLYDEISSDIVTSEDEKLGYIVQKKNDDGIRCGYIDNLGKLKLELEYNDILRVNNNDEIYIIASKNGQYGFLKNYENIIDFVYQDIEYDNENNLLILQKGTKYGVANLDGNIVVQPENKELEIKGMYIYTKKENEQNVFNSKGEKQDIDFNTTITKTKNEKYNIIIKNQDSKNIYGVIDNEGKKVIDEKYLYLEYAYGDYFIVCGENGKLGVIDKNDNVIVDLKYDLVQKINDRDVIQTLSVDTKTTSIYSSNMEKMIEMQNASININENYIKVYSNDDLEYLDNNGNIIESKEIFDSKLYASKENDKWGFKDVTGQFMIEPKYERVTDFNEYGFAGIKQNGKWGAINEDGEIIVEPKYEFNSDYIEIEFINKYYKNQYGFGEIYYTDNK